MVNRERANRYVKILEERLAPYEMEGFEYGIVTASFYYPERIDIDSFMEAKERAQRTKEELGFLDETIRNIVLNTLADSLNESKYNTVHKLLSRAIRLIAEPIQKQEDNKPAPQAFGSDKFTMRKIAILHRYLGEEITVGNRNEIALSYGYSSPTSGDKLYNYFNALRRPTDRAGKHKFAIRDIEAILLLLRENYPDDEKAISMAEDELNLAKVNNTK